MAEASEGLRGPKNSIRGGYGQKILIAFAFVLSVSAARASDSVMLSGRAMGTSWSVKFVQPAVPLAPAIVERAVSERLEQLEQIFSTYRPQSGLSRFNAVESTEWIPVAPELAHVAGESRQISELTGGAFDVTVHPLVQLWGFGSKPRSNSGATPGDIAAALVLVGWRQLEVRPNPPALRKARPRISVDLSSMAKGFAADSVSELLSLAGAPNHLVLVGGDVKSGGAGPGGAGWRVGIERPADQQPAIAGTVMLRGNALSTSGDYRNYSMAGGRRYGHIIDPRTGEPVSRALVSASVIHASSATSSALATALFVLGPEEGFRFATEQRLACLFQMRDGSELDSRSTPEFKWREFKTRDGDMID
jgi:thiamine biosynthesis lipoprotein